MSRCPPGHAGGRSLCPALRPENQGHPPSPPLLRPPLPASPPPALLPSPTLPCPPLSAHVDSTARIKGAGAEYGSLMERDKQVRRLLADPMAAHLQPVPQQPHPQPPTAPALPVVGDRRPRPAKAVAAAAPLLEAIELASDLTLNGGGGSSSGVGSGDQAGSSRAWGGTAPGQPPQAAPCGAVFGVLNFQNCPCHTGIRAVLEGLGGIWPMLAPNSEPGSPGAKEIGEAGAWIADEGGSPIPGQHPATPPPFYRGLVPLKPASLSFSSFVTGMVQSALVS